METITRTCDICKEPVGRDCNMWMGSEVKMTGRLQAELGILDSIFHLCGPCSIDLWDFLGKRHDYADWKERVMEYRK